MTYQAQVFLFAILVALIFSVEAQSCKGCVTLDEHAFAKIIPHFPYALVKFDIAYPYGAKHEAYVAFAETLVNVTDVLVGEVGIKDYGNKENAAFAELQGVDGKSLPVIKLYARDNAPETFTEEDITVEALREWVLSVSALRLTLPGCIEEWDALAARFGNADEQEVMLHQAQHMAETETQPTRRRVMDIYIRYMQKVMEEGQGFIGKELMRLRKIVAEGKLSDAKKSDLGKRINILHAFDAARKSTVETQKGEL